jgi:L-lactate dehydrogenase complex protein LldF
VGLRFFTDKDGWIRKLPNLGARWTLSRDLPGMPDQTFRQWWAERDTSRPREVLK